MQLAWFSTAPSVPPGTENSYRASVLIELELLDGHKIRKECFFRASIFVIMLDRFLPDELRDQGGAICAR